MVADAPSLTSAPARLPPLLPRTRCWSPITRPSTWALRAAASETGVEFTNRVPRHGAAVGDALGRAAPHALEALAARLGVDIAPGARHRHGRCRGDGEISLRLILRWRWRAWAIWTGIRRTGPPAPPPDRRREYRPAQPIWASLARRQFFRAQGAGEMAGGQMRAALQYRALAGADRLGLRGVQKTQPEGGFIGEAIRPAGMMRLSRSSRGSGIGTADSSACV